MQETPPRRSRRPPTSDTGSSFPLIPILLGTVVIGFVIGAGLSIAGKRGPERTAVAIVTPAPTVEATLPPATFAPTESPTREPTSEPATRPPAKAAPATKMQASPALPTQPPATRRPARTTELAPSALPVSPAPSTAHVPAATPASPGPPGPAVAAAAPQPTGAPPSTDDADSDFARVASGVVRGYLAAVARGDSASAASALAGSDDRVTETSVVDATTRIKHVEARGAGDAAATVNVDFDTAGGAYFGQYTVRRTPTGAAVIVAHTIIKP